jgi:hypothetical protein
MLEKKP